MFLFLYLFPQCLRFLEEGSLEEAEIQKQRIEQLQRERRRVLEENKVEHQPRFFRYVCSWGRVGHCWQALATPDASGVKRTDWGVPSPRESVLSPFPASEW